jgi:hypothetical protein
MQANVPDHYPAPTVDLDSRQLQANAHGIYKGWILSTSKSWALGECFRMGGDHLHTPFIAIFYRCRLSR